MRRAGNVSTVMVFSERHFASPATKAPVEGGVKEAEHRADVRVCTRALQEQVRSLRFLSRKAGSVAQLRMTILICEVVEAAPFQSSYP
jgi:uncharacterized protein (DUF1697 family)